MVCTAVVPRAPTSDWGPIVLGTLKAQKWTWLLPQRVYNLFYFKVSLEEHCDPYCCALAFTIFFLFFLPSHWFVSPSCCVCLKLACNVLGAGILSYVYWWHLTHIWALLKKIIVNTMHFCPHFLFYTSWRNCSAQVTFFVSFFPHLYLCRLSYHHICWAFPLFVHQMTI